MPLRPPFAPQLREEDAKDPARLARILRDFMEQTATATREVIAELGGDGDDSSTGTGINTPEVIASTNAGQTVTDNASTIIDFEDVEIDTDGIVTTGAAWKVTFPEPGTVEVLSSVEVNYGSSVNFDSFLSVCKNGAEVRRGSRVTGNPPGVGANYVAGVWVSALVRVAAGDYLDIRAFQRSGGNRTLEAYGPGNFVSMRRVR